MMDLDDRETMLDPYPHYRTMRRVGPIQFNHHINKWQITGYPEIKSLLKNDDLSSEVVDSELARRNPIERVFAKLLIRSLTEMSRNLLFIMDPPRHKRIRSLVTQVFVPGEVERMRPWVEELAQTLLRDAVGTGARDFMDTFAYPFPLAVIAQLLGVEALAEPRMRRWAHDVSAVFVKAHPTPVEAVKGNFATRAVRRFMREEIDSRWGLPPRDDLLGLLMAARDGSDRLTRKELVDTAILFLFAGHETTTNLLGNALVVLEHRPETLQRMRADPTFTGQVVEEVLRFEPSVQNVERVVQRPFTLEGHRFQAGDGVVLSLAAGNRDPRVFDQPDTFQPGRRTRHLTFGHGIHFCIGAALTRLEVQVALQAFVNQVDRFRLGDRRYRHSQAHRGMEYLEIEASHVNRPSTTGHPTPSSERR